MIVWLNGTFGVGKTTTAKLLADSLKARVFDSEHVGFLLQRIMPDVAFDDFKEWEPWRSLTVATAAEVQAFAGGDLLIPQSVLQREIWTDLAERFAKAELDVRAFTLHADRDTLTGRIGGDLVHSADTRQWRLDHRDEYQAALPWLRRETTLVDTAALTPEQVADRIAAAVRA